MRQSVACTLFEPVKRVACGYGERLRSASAPGGLFESGTRKGAARLFIGVEADVVPHVVDCIDGLKYAHKSESFRCVEPFLRNTSGAYLPIPTRLIGDDVVFLNGKQKG